MDRCDTYDIHRWGEGSYGEKALMGQWLAPLLLSMFNRLVILQWGWKPTGLVFGSMLPLSMVKTHLVTADSTFLHESPQIIFLPPTHTTLVPWFPGSCSILLPTKRSPLLSRGGGGGGGVQQLKWNGLVFPHALPVNVEHKLSCFLQGCLFWCHEPFLSTKPFLYK